MRIRYLLVWNPFSSRGVPNKVRETVRTWRSLGVDASVDLLTRSDAGVDWVEEQARASESVPWRVWRYDTLLQRHAITARVLSNAMRDEVDVVYTRFDFFHPRYAVRRMRPRLVLEVNSDDLQELDNRLVKALYHRLTRRLMLRSADGIVFVSHELRDRRSFSSRRVPTVVIANGVTLKPRSVTMKPRDAEAPTKILFTGTAQQRWHGIDKILWLAAANPQWEVDLVGISATEWPAAPSNVRFHGSLPPLEYEGILRAADVAVGTLALHRLGMDEASPLKVREYLAEGIPSIIGYRDTDFPKAPPFLLQLPNQEENVRSHLPQIRSFVAAWRGRRVPLDDVACIDLVEKERSRIRFFRELMTQ